MAMGQRTKRGVKIMREFTKYGDIENLYRTTEILAQEDVVITEKIHGTIRCGGRNREFVEVNSQYDGYGFQLYVDNLPEQTKKHLEYYPGYIFYGEFFGAGIQKGIQYRADREKEFRVFDIKNSLGKYVSYQGMKVICQFVGLKTVPLVARGKVTQEMLEDLINIESKTGKENSVEEKENFAEGVVLKPAIPCLDSHGNWMRAKFKSDKWKEKANAPKIPKSLDPKVQAMILFAEDFAAEVVTEGRIHTIVEHITRDGNITIDMTRTPDFLKEMTKDIWKEHKPPEDKETLKIFNKKLSSTAIPMWKKFVSENYRK
jgi:Rnl2 family RNA ligase